MTNKQFKLTSPGLRIYRYIDNNGVKGCYHYSKNNLTPVKQINFNDKTYVNLDGGYFEVNNLKELDSIENALNNPQKSLQKVLEIPSSIIAKTDPDLYKKVLYAIRTSIIFNTQLTNSKKARANSAYEELDLIVKKLTKIDKEAKKLQISENVQEKI